MSARNMRSEVKQIVICTIIDTVSVIFSVLLRRATLHSSSTYSYKTSRRSIAPDRCPMSIKWPQIPPLICQYVFFFFIIQNMADQCIRLIDLGLCYFRFKKGILWIIIWYIYSLLCGILRTCEQAVQCTTEWTGEYTMFVTGADNSVHIEEHFLWINKGYKNLNEHRS